MGVFLVLLVSQELFRRYPKFTLYFWLAVPFILYTCWLLLWGESDWFPWMKVFSIEVGIIVLSIYRNTSLGKHKFGQWVIYGLLATNIFEAVFRDVISGGAPNYLNAVAGVLLVLTLEKISSIHIDSKTKHKDLSWRGMTLQWIAGYTIWNWVFVYLNFGVESAIQHFAVLAAAFVVALIDRERWLQARVLTLGTYFIIFHTVPHLNPDKIGQTVNSQFSFYAALVSFVFMFAYAISYSKRQALAADRKKH